MREITEAEIDAGAEALRQCEQGGRLLRKWENLPNSDRRKWRDKAAVVLAAAAKVSPETQERRRKDLAAIIDGSL